MRHLAGFRTGELTLVEPGAVRRFGGSAADGLAAQVEVHSPAFYDRLAWGGTLGAAESYLDGEWSSDQLTAVVQLMIRNAQSARQLESWGAWLWQPLERVRHWLQRNSKSGSRKNIAAHYDLGNDFFATFLDESLAYSSAVYERPEMTLAEAQTAKFERLCRKLDLQPSDHLLEIGCGWGGMAIHAARHYGCRVTATTISQRQFELSRQRIREAGLENRIELVMQDYRELRGQYDKLVSVEMIEAVGQRYLDAYFAACSSLLKPTGLMVLQGITIADQLYAAYCRSVDFIQKHVFPGGHLPSLTAIQQSLTRATDLKLFHLEDLPQHYARTLAAWRERFEAAAPEHARQGLSEEFRRLWRFYLCYCEGGFREQQLGLIQAVLVKPQCRRAGLL